MDFMSTEAPSSSLSVELPEPAVGAEVDCPGGNDVEGVPPQQETEEDSQKSASPSEVLRGRRRPKRPEDRNCTCCNAEFERQGRSFNRRAVYTFTSTETVQWAFPGAVVHEKSFLCEPCAQFIRSKVRVEKQEERSQDGEEEQSGGAVEQVVLQGRFQITLVCQRRPEAHDGVLAQTAERGDENTDASDRQSLPSEGVEQEATVVLSLAALSGLGPGQSSTRHLLPHFAVPRHQRPFQEQQQRVDGGAGSDAAGAPGCGRALHPALHQEHLEEQLPAGRSRSRAPLARLLWLLSSCPQHYGTVSEQRHRQVTAA